MTNTPTPSGNWSLYLTKNVSAWHDKDNGQTQTYLGTVTGPDWQPRGIYMSLHDGESVDEIAWTVQLDGAEEESDPLAISEEEVWYNTRGDAVAAINAFVEVNSEMLNRRLLKAQAKAAQA